MRMLVIVPEIAKAPVSMPAPGAAVLRAAVMSPAC
jgi:hypothetical protein